MRKHALTLAVALVFSACTRANTFTPRSTPLASGVVLISVEARGPSSAARAMEAWYTEVERVMLRSGCADYEVLEHSLSTETRAWAAGGVASAEPYPSVSGRVRCTRKN